MLVQSANCCSSWIIICVRGDNFNLVGEYFGGGNNSLSYYSSTAVQQYL